MLKPQQVRQLVVAAETGSFKSAATATFRSQAAVTLALRELEHTLGARLIERDRRGKFTPLAHALVPMLKEFLTVHDLVYAQARQLAQGLEGSLSVAVAPFLAAQWLPELLVEFAELYPDIRIRTIEERSSRIRGLVADGGVSIGVAGLLADDPKLRITPVAIDAYGVLCSRAHPLSRKRTVSWSSLKGATLIGSDASEALTATGLAPPLPAPRLVITSRAPLLACVARNLGLTVLTTLTRPEPDRTFAFLPLTRPHLSRQVSILTRRSDSLLPAAQRLVDAMAKSLRAYAAARGARAA